MRSMFTVKGSILQYFCPSLSYHFVIKIFVLSIFEWPFYTSFTVVPTFFMYNVTYIKVESWMWSNMESPIAEGLCLYPKAHIRFR